MPTPNTNPPMMPEGGFFRVDQNGIFLHGKNFVHAPWGTLLRGLHLSGQGGYTYPTTDGWRWFDTLEEAVAFYNLPADTLPFGYTLRVNA